ncbi:hypothetical protein Pcinc_000920 [Petrolisthes cinctipes]|uniref:PHD-type domain-containing protein n=1 Tax=Petrolisthes cinctipes TaxID=88211 RepID=A0AAE1L3N2_PETCI|nr:hypothetical protein Pcinc_000920 [Petrolisthes cinctipes]
MGSPVDELCLVCHERDDGKVKWLKCLKCKLGGHSTCTRMTGLKSNASEVNWVCDPCALVIKSEVHLREEINVMKSDIIEIKNMLKDIRLPENLQNSVMAALPALTDRVILAVEEAVSAQSGQVEKDGMNWADLVSRSRKRKRTQKNKNLLIIKAKGSEKAVDMKKEVEELLSDVQIMDSKFTNKGNIVINLESEEKRNAAQNKLHEVGNLIVSNGKRWDPKIMVFYMRDMLLDFHVDTNVELRHSSEVNRLLEPRFRRECGKRAFANSAPRLYNNLPSFVRAAETAALFKKRLKTHLFTESYNLINEEMRPSFRL